MIDYIKIILKNFSGNLNNCKEVESRKLIKHPEEEKYSYGNYRLYNNSNIEKHYLKVSLNKKTGVLTLSGSLRKRAYNRITMLDIPKNQFVRVLKGIAKELGISFEELKLAKFTQCEIGANIRTRIPAIDILPLIVAYGCFERIDEYIEKGTLYFKGSERLLKLYVKDDEIAAHTFSEEKRILKKMAFDRLKIKGIHHLRIEFTLKDHEAFKNKGMKHIETIGDLIEHYSDLYKFWTKEISHITVYNKLKYAEEDLSKKEKEIVIGLEKIGYFQFVDTYQKYHISRTESAKSAKSAKSNALKTIHSVLDKYFDHKEYNKYNLRADVAKYLIRKSNQIQLNLRPLIRNLWDVSTLNK